MDQTAHSLTVRYVGVGLAVLATSLASPSGSARFGRAMFSAARCSLATAVKFVRWILRHPKGQTISVGVMAAGVGMGNATISATAAGVANQSLDQRFDALETDVKLLRQQHADAQIANAKQFAQITQDVGAIRGAAEGLRRTFFAHERANDAIDASALPAIGVGILLSALPDQLVTEHRWVDVLLLAVAAGAMLW